MSETQTTIGMQKNAAGWSTTRRSSAYRRQALLSYVPDGPDTPRGRGAFTLIELMVSGILLGVVMLIAVPTLDWIGKEGRATERRRQALIEVANIMDRITVQPWEQITTEAMGQLEPAPHLQGRFSGLELSVNVFSDPAQADAKRVVAELRWKDDKGQMVAPVCLTAWAYRDGRSQ